jgi:hypothetical protein
MVHCGGGLAALLLGLAALTRRSRKNNARRVMLAHQRDVAAGRKQVYRPASVGFQDMWSKSLGALRGGRPAEPAAAEPGREHAAAGRARRGYQLAARGGASPALVSASSEAQRPAVPQSPKPAKYNIYQATGAEDVV